jgi:hypothetical protein
VALGGWVTSQKKWDTQTMTHWTLSAALSPQSFNTASAQKVVCSLREVENLVGQQWGLKHFNTIALP